MALEVLPGTGASLSATFRQVGLLCLLSLRGALCADTLRIVEAQVDHLGCTACRRVVIDVTGLTAVDDAGLRLLTGLQHYVEARGGSLRLEGAGSEVLEALAATALATTAMAAPLEHVPERHDPADPVPGMLTGG